MSDETVDSERNPYHNALTDADMLENFNSNSEDEKKIMKLNSLYKSTLITWLYFFFFKIRLVRRNIQYCN